MAVGLILENGPDPFLLVDEVLTHQPMRQWVLSVPFPLRNGAGDYKR